MDKFYIVTNKKFLDEIEDFKENEKKRNAFIKDFFENNGIAGTGYYIRGDGFVNEPFSEGNKENIELFIDNCEENITKFGKQLLKEVNFQGGSLRRFRKGCAILKHFQNRCIEEKIIINSHFHREGDYFKELHMGGYSVTRFTLNGKYFLRISTTVRDSITPEYEGFEEIKGSEFHRALEEYEETERERLLQHQ